MNKQPVLVNTKFRDNIIRLENVMLNMDQIEIEINHYFADGMYAREMIMPRGSTVIGKIHKKEHFCVISKGIVEIRSEEKSERIKAPFIYKSGSGAKRSLHAIEDVVWTTFHPTNETDLDKLEAEHIANDFKSLDAYLDNEDHKKFLLEHGISDKLAVVVSENTEDMMDINLEKYHMEIASSIIHGKGVFFSGIAVKGQFLAPSRIGIKRTPVGRYTNHSKNPNSKMVFHDAGVNLVAIRNISKEELTVDYREVLNTKRILSCLG